MNLILVRAVSAAKQLAMRFVMVVGSVTVGRLVQYPKATEFTVVNVDPLSNVRLVRALQ